MAAFNGFEDFIAQLGLGTHNLNTDQVNVYLTNNAPSASADSVLTDLTGITAQNGYAVADTTNTYAEASGTGTVTVVDVVWTGTTADPAFGPFRYVPTYNVTSASDNLINWWDYGSSISVNNGETFTVDFTGNTLLTIAFA